MKRHKYSAIRCELDGISFASKAERDRYAYLKLLERAGEIDQLTVQPKFELLPKNGKERAIRYVGDFSYIEQDTGLVVEDVKGVETQVWRMKAKMFRAKYPDVTLRTVKRKGKGWDVK